MLTFNEKEHKYEWNGTPVPSVTTVINAHFPNKFKWIHPAKLRELADRGKIVHRMTELHDLGQLDPLSVDPRLQGFLDAWIKFRTEFKCVVQAVEHMVYNPIHKYAGTVDRVIEKDGLDYVLDLKTGDWCPTYEMQVAAYTMAESMTQTIGYCVTIKEDGSYHLKKTDINQGWANFLACLRVYNLKKEMKEID